jgi:hypothetical protein
LSHLPGAAAIETLIWQALIVGISGFADEPYRSLFSYDSSYPLRSAVTYMAPYGDNLGFVEMVKAALREDRAGSSAIAGALIRDGHTACLPEALDRAMKVIGRPAANESDVFSAVMLVLEEGSDAQRRQYAMLISQFKSRNPDYAAFLQLKLSQTPKGRL